MTDAKMLKDWIDGQGVTITFLAQKLGCTRNRVYSILAGSDCTAREIVVLSEALHMSPKVRDAIFLSTNVIENH